MSDTCGDVFKCLQDTKFQKKIASQLRNLQDVDEVESSNICRIHVHARSFDWTQPPNRNKGGSGTGTGFMLDAFPPRNGEIYIVTAHHVIAHNVQIKVSFSKIHSEYIDAVLVGCNADMDVAMLAISDSQFSKKIEKTSTTGLKIGKSDVIRSPATVTAHGFALGKPHMQTTKGVVSGRIDGPSRLQTDVAVNPGNSGGPLLNEDNEVIGIVTSGMVDAQGINYVAPIDECQVILERILKKWTSTGKTIADRLPSLNCSFTKSNRVLLNQINGCKSGVFCSSVHPLIEYPQNAKDAADNIERNLATLDNEDVRKCMEFLNTYPVVDTLMTRDHWAHILLKNCPSKHLDAILSMLRNNTLMEGDIVCSMTVRQQTYEIDLQMTSKFEYWHDNLGFTSILDRLNCTHDTNGDTVGIEFFRGQKRYTINMQLQPQHNTFRKLYADVENVEYTVLGGIFCMSLLHNHVPLFRREPLHTLMTRPSSRHLSILIISHILPESPFNECETIGAGDVLVGINNSQVVTIDDCVRAWDAEMKKGGSITLRMRDGSFATATTTQIEEANVVIEKEYKSKEYIGYHNLGENVEQTIWWSKFDTIEKLTTPPSSPPPSPSPSSPPPPSPSPSSPPPSPSPSSPPPSRSLRTPSPITLPSAQIVPPIPTAQSPAGSDSDSSSEDESTSTSSDTEMSSEANGAVRDGDEFRDSVLQEVLKNRGLRSTWDAFGMREP